MSTDFRRREGGKSESGVNDHTVNKPTSPHRDRTLAWSFLSVMKAWMLGVETYTLDLCSFIGDYRLGTYRR